MQRHAVHRSRHAMLTNAVIDIAPFAVFSRERSGCAGFGIVRAGEVCRAANCVGECVIDDAKCHFGGFAGGDFFRLCGKFGFVGFDCRGKSGEVCCHCRVEGGFV